MKLVLLSITFLFSNSIFSQVKILFDASKAETAANADWIIDADTHNLGFGTGPAVAGGGNESNAQRVPTPAQSGISAGTTETFWNGSLSSWGIDCVKKGYQVETLPYNGHITFGSASNAQDLSNYNVFIICEPNIIFTATEKNAIMNFIQNGGGLFMVSDHDQSDRNNDGWDSPHIWNDLMSSNTVQINPFGITFDYANFSETTTNIPTLPTDSLLHGPMGTVTEMQWANGTSMTLSPSQNASVKGVVYKTGSTTDSLNAMVVYARFGNGKVAAIGDSSPADDGTGDSNDALYNGWTADAAGNHELLIMNATIWLATPNQAITTTIAENKIADYTSINFYPNPFSTTASVEIETSEPITNATIMIYNVLGNKVKQINNINTYRFKIERTDLIKGIYFYSFINKNGNTANGKIVVED